MPVPVTDRSVGVWGARTAPAVEWGLLCSLDSRWYLTALGDGWEDMLGWTREELFSRPFMDFVHPTERERTLAEIAAAWQGDTAAIALETRFRARSGRWQRTRWSPLPDRSELAATAPARTSPARPWRDRAVVRAALRAAVALALVCAAIGLGFLLTSFAPQDSPAARPLVASEAPAGMDGPVSSLGPTLRMPDETAPPGLVGTPLSRLGTSPR